MKIHEIFCENPRIIFVLFYDVHKENKFTINLEDGLPVFAAYVHIVDLTWGNIYADPEPGSALEKNSDPRDKDIFNISLF